MSTSIVIGIDPGISGALSLFVNGTLTDVRDMPVIETVKPSKGADIRDLIGGKKDHKRRDIDKHALAALLRDWTAGRSAKAWIEKVGARPNQNNNRFLEAIGIIHGIAAALSIEVETVLPGEWKRQTGTPADKGLACAHAAKVFPEWASLFKRVSIDHNRAEAALIGLYGVQTDGRR